MKIFDCFQFFNEFDLLEIRLEMLYDHVDYFVISETNRTHSDLPKPFYLQEKLSTGAFAKYADKIRLITTCYPANILKFQKLDEKSMAPTNYRIKINEISDIYDKEEHEGQLKQYPTFCRDYLQREFCKLGLLDAADDDLIMVSDLDEIPNPDVVDMVRETKKTRCVFNHNCYYYYVNLIAHTNWFGAYVVEYKDAKDVSLTHMRGDSQRIPYDRIADAGWHLSFMGGADRVREKIRSYSHQEFNNSYILNSVEDRMNNKKDLFFRGNNTYQSSVQQFYYDDMLHVSMDTYPEKMRNLIQDKFSYLIKN